MRWVVLLFALPGFGQTQDIQQLMLDIEKLAQMKATYQAMINGYKTLEAGYNSLSGITKVNYDLHKDWLDKLVSVSPFVQQHPKVDDIVQHQKLLVNEYIAGIRWLQSKGQLKAAEMMQLRSLLLEIRQSSDHSIDELIDVMTPGKFRMNDEERLAVIGRIDAAVAGYLEKLRSVLDEYRRLSEARAKREKEAAAIKALYGIKH